LWKAGKLLLQVADLRHERVRAYFDEPDIGKLAVGQKIQIKWDGPQTGPRVARTRRPHALDGDRLRHAHRGRSAGGRSTVATANCCRIPT
jgi:hypothetical protein